MDAVRSEFQEDCRPIPAGVVGPAKSTLVPVDLFPNRALGKLTSVGDVSAHVQAKLDALSAAREEQAKLHDAKPSNLFFHD